MPAVFHENDQNGRKGKQKKEISTEVSLYLGFFLQIQIVHLIHYYVFI